jgi:Family of unknown function (DUF6325)
VSEAGSGWVGDEVASDLVEYLILAVPGADSLAVLVPALADLVASGVVRILDVVAVARDSGGAITVRELEEVESLRPLADMDGEVGRLLSANDIELTSLAVRPGTTGVVLVAEDRWLRSLAVAAREAGGQIVAGERIPAARVQAVLDDAPDSAWGGS